MIRPAHVEQIGLPQTYNSAPCAAGPAIKRAFCSAWTIMPSFISDSLRRSALSSTPLGNPLYPRALAPRSVATTAPILALGSFDHSATKRANSQNLLSHFFLDVSDEAI